MEGKLGKLAMELAEETANELDLDMNDAKSATDVFQKLFKNPGKLMGMVKTVGSKLDEKLKSGEIKESELNTFRNKKFLSMNRNVNKYHRYNLLLEYYNGDYGNSYFSFLDKLNTDLAKTFSIINLDKLNEINKILPIEIDTHSVKNKMGFRVDNTYKKEIFLDSCINIVTETSFIDNELFLSEKILKPILMYQPFIVLGPSKILSHLKSYGFKTFGELWNEEYDDVEDFKQRLEIVLKLINKLNQKSIEELNELYQKTKEICIYNRRLFETLQVNSIPQIFKEIENEW
jgi:hypothetical protein